MQCQIYLCYNALMSSKLTCSPHMKMPIPLAGVTLAVMRKACFLKAAGRPLIG